MRNRQCLTTLTLCSLSALSSSLPAAEHPWKHELDAGINGATGNSESLSLHTGYNGSFKDANHGWKISSAYDNAKSNGIESRRQFFADLLKDWFWSESPWFAFAQGRYDWDRFKEWDYRLSLAAGGGYEFLNNDTWYLAGRFGLGGNKTYGDEEETFTPEATLGLEAAWTISNHESVDFKTTFYPSLKESGEYRNISSLSWRMSMGDSRNVAMKIGLSNEYDTLAAPGTETNDFKYNLSLVWDL
jgi:putative salt-induced outer membrane protein YdiY